MELIHILPKENLKNRSKPYQKYELYLVDDILANPEFYLQNVRDTPGYKILDNSLNELGFSRGMEELNAAAEIIKPDEFVVPDALNLYDSRHLLEECIATVSYYENLKDLKKMAVVHGNCYREHRDYFKYLLDLPEVDVIGFPKVLLNRVNITYLYGLFAPKEIHFLGFVGFDEFADYGCVTQKIRTLDSRMMLETDNLWNRDDILSNVSLDYGRVIPDIESKITRVRREYESYGLC